MNQNKQRGITLIETIVALNILVMGVVASLTLATSSLNFSQSSEQSLVVVSLAREGLEIVRAIRDNDGLSAIPNDTVKRIVDSDYFFGINHEVSGYYTVNTCGECRLYINVNGIYNHSGGTPTVYQRLIEIYPVSATERRIVSIVGWQEHGRSHQYKLETYFSNWK